ncbi:conserved hypothetical protein [Trichophyton verrucosum HKI 0517]|uniref:Glycoprotease family protein n=1 Tax=Trichophyton verrucosum (strain HKI 0517) TaxID=663202 RepID=D4D4G3_TRIVH|nr:uncharacterized protein TRV_01979 [Trichophyton verrucosum HKI 0517]EFE43310.1 conserved hypothetical protein [Trichophyton verrucosum HKI 0517]
MSNNPFTASYGQRRDGPKPAELQIPQIPNFPLSSPIHEELLTPFDDLDSSPDPSNPFTSPEDAKEETFSSNNPFLNPKEGLGGISKLKGRWGSVKQPTRVNVTRRSPKPGLNLVTNFSSPGAQSRTYQWAEQQQQQRQDQDGTKHLSEVAEMDSQSISTSRSLSRTNSKSLRIDTSQLKPRSRPARVEKRQSARKGPIRLFQKPLSPEIAVSPSDRPIVIGVSVPLGSPAALAFSSDARSTPGRANSIHSLRSHGNTPVTPTIVVTPACEERHWASDKMEEAVPPRPRPASSIYSTATPLARGVNKVEDIPPVPALPPPGAYGGQGIDDPFGTMEAISERRRRVLSSGTLFEEEDSPSRQINRPRSFSNKEISRNESGLVASTSRFSLETISPRRRSEGWWNYLLSPLLSRSSTMTTINTLHRNGSQGDDEGPPPVPELPNNTRLQLAIPNRHDEPTLTNKEWRDKQVSVFSPITPETATEKGSPSVKSPASGWRERLVSVFSPITPDSAGTSKEKRILSNVTEWPGMDHWYFQQEKSQMKVDTGNLTLNTTVKNKGNVTTSPKHRENEEHRTSLCSAVTSQSIPFMMSDPSSHHASVSTGANHSSRNIANNQSFASYSRGATNKDSNPNICRTNSHKDQNTNNPFFQQFVDSIRGEDGRRRSDSASTMIEEDEPDISPNVRHATATPIFHHTMPTMVGTRGPPAPIAPPAAAQRTSVSSSGSDSSCSPEPTPERPKNKIAGIGTIKRKTVPKYHAILPPDRQSPLESPGPLSPEAQATLNSGGIQMNDVPLPRRPDRTYLLPATNDFPRHPKVSPVIMQTPIIRQTPKIGITKKDVKSKTVIQQKKVTRKEVVGQDSSFWRGQKCRCKQGCAGNRDCEGRRKRRKCCWIIIILILLFLIGLGILLGVLLTRKGPGQSQPPRPPGSGPQPTPGQEPGQKMEDDRWLNLTGYPPIPTGISTVAGPSAANINSGCIAPTSMWSCSLPKEMQDANKPFDADQPRFKIEIKFKNGTYQHSTTIADKGKREVPTLSNLFVLGNWARRQYPLERRDEFTPSPAPPSVEEQSFLGNTTDKTAAPFEGEETPFFVTVLDTAPPKGVPGTGNSARFRRSEPEGFPDLSKIIPPPALDTDGTAAPATLYPFPSSQPLRLYDRGLPTEHYGFYTYYDRSIFLKSSRPIGDGKETGNIPSDLDGGSTKSAASVQCTWAQTRFLVQIWTQASKAGLELMSPSGDPGPKPPSYAEDFRRPGSLPYPITITLDRHGGDPKKKFVYCYGLDVGGKPIMTKKKLQLEHRDVGGVLVNPAPGIFNISSSSKNSKRADVPGIDGGSGGCHCEWRNWLKA